MADVIARCLHECSTGSELCTWNPPSARSVKGLPEYVMKNGVWRLIKALSGLDGTLTFAVADVEKAVHVDMPDAEPSKVVVEAKKLLVLLSGWRRVIRHGAVPDQLRMLMGNKKR